MLTNEQLNKLFDLLEPNVDMETGLSGEGLYGNYVEWQSLEKYEEETLNGIFEILGITVPEKNCTKKIQILRELGVPEETAYEFGGNFPESQAAFNRGDQERYYNEIERIRDLIKNQTDEMVIRSLLLSAFVYAESVITAIITDRLKKVFSGMTNRDSVHEKIQESIVKKLHVHSERKDIYPILFDGLTLGKIPYFEIRHIIAHDISKDRIENGEIVIGSNQRYSIETILTELSNYTESEFRKTVRFQ